MSERLTDAEREALICDVSDLDEDYLYLDWLVETIEAILAARLAEQAEQIAQAIEALPEHDGDGWPVRAHEAKADAASIARNHGAAS